MDLQLRNIRKEKGLRQKDVADAIGVLIQTISMWESGKVRIPLEDACKCADFLGCSLDALAGREPFGADYFTSVFNSLNDEGQKYLMKQARYALSDTMFQPERLARKVQ